MVKKHKAAFFLVLGFSPSTIAEIMGITTSTVVDYLYNQVGEGTIRRSDLLFSVDKQTRTKVEELIKGDRRNVRDRLRRISGGNAEDGTVYYALRDSFIPRGDVYDYLSRIEVFLHNHVRENLARHLSPGRWWRDGVPENIRAECAEAL